MLFEVFLFVILLYFYYICDNLKILVIDAISAYFHSYDWYMLSWWIGTILGAIFGIVLSISAAYGLKHGDPPKKNDDEPQIIEIKFTHVKYHDDITDD